MSHEHATEPGLTLVSESLRERIAKHSAIALASNFEQIFEALASGSTVGPQHCPDCNGLGFVELTAERVAAWTVRFAEEREAWKRRIAEVVDQNREDNEGRDASSKSALDWKKVEGLRRQQGEAEVRLRYACNRETICTACEGTCYTQDDGDPYASKVPPDSMWTTVQCWACTGRDTRRHPLLLRRHRGSSDGRHPEEAVLPAGIDGRCPECLGDAYLAPITARPGSSGQGFDADGVPDVDQVPLRRRCYAEQAAKPKDEVSSFLGGLRGQDPKLAAAVMVLFGPIGDEWARHQFGRSFALWPLAEHGPRLLDESHETSSVAEEYRRQLDIFAKTRAACVQRPERADDKVLALISMADDEARMLAHRAEQAVQKAEAA